MSATIETKGETAIVRMDWPEFRNSLDAPRAIELQEALTDAQNLPDCRAVVIAGTPRSFCSGGDLRFFLSLAQESADHLRNLIASVYQPLITAIVQSPVPVLAAVDGPAIGLGMDIAVAADVCFMGPGSWLMQGWARAGLIPGAGGLFLLDRALPKHSIWQLLVEQSRLSPTRSAELGLAVDCGQQQAEDRALEFARQVTQLPRATITGYKRLLQGLTQGLTAHLDQAQEIQAGLLTSTVFTDRALKIMNAAKGSG